MPCSGLCVCTVPLVLSCTNVQYVCMCLRSMWPVRISPVVRTRQPQNTKMWGITWRTCFTIKGWTCQLNIPGFLRHQEHLTALFKYEWMYVCRLAMYVCTYVHITSQPEWNYYHFIVYVVRISTSHHWFLIHFRKTMPAFVARKYFRNWLLNVVSIWLESTASFNVYHFWWTVTQKVGSTPTIVQHTEGAWYVGAQFLT